jgi:hypothetical protein
MEKRLHAFVCQTFAHHSYPEFDHKLRELRAIPLMHSIWAAHTVLTAKELKDVLRRTLDENDRILVVEVSGGWASRRAENNLGELVPPRVVRLWPYGSSAGRSEPGAKSGPGAGMVLNQPEILFVMFYLLIGQPLTG